MKLWSKILFCALFLFPFYPGVTKAGVSVIGGLTRENVAGSGESFQGIIMLKNSSLQPAEVKIYQTDYQFFADGSNLYGEAGKLRRSNASWITYGPHRLVIPPQGTSKLNYSVTVPDSENLSGSYWSMLMVEEISQDSPESSGSGARQFQLGIRQIWRLGIQMVTHIGNSGIRNLEFIKTALQKEEENLLLLVDIENTGERWLRPSLWVGLYDVEGRYLGRFDGPNLRIYPGTSARFRVALNSVPPGSYKALVAADCGGDHVFGINHMLNLE